jgi:hypothetical protein
MTPERYAELAEKLTYPGADPTHLTLIRNSELAELLDGCQRLLDEVNCRESSNDQSRTRETDFVQENARLTAENRELHDALANAVGQLASEGTL